MLWSHNEFYFRTQNETEKFAGNDFLVFRQAKEKKTRPTIENIHGILFVLDANEGKGTNRFSDLFVVKIERKIPMRWQIDDGKIVLTPIFLSAASSRFQSTIWHVYGLQKKNKTKEIAN